MIRESDIKPSNRRLDNQELLAVGREFGMHPPAGAELEEACALASRLMDHEVVSAAKLQEVQVLQPAAVLVFKEEGRVTAVSGQLMLRRSAVRPIFEDRFDAIDLDIQHLCREGEEVALGYGWGLAASTKTAGRAARDLGLTLKAGVFAEIPTLARAITPVGRHLALTRYGYVPMRHPDDDLMIIMPAGAAERRAA